MPSFTLGMRCFAVTLALAVAAPGRAQDADLAERLFSSGARAYAAKAYPEALETWGQLIQTAPKSGFAAQALLQMAQYQLEVEKKPEAALPFLDRIKTEHLKTPWAAPALLLRGRLLAERNGPQDLKEAMAEFNRVVDLFPDSPQVQAARFGLGSACLLQSQWGRALQHFTEVIRLDPATQLGRRAHLQTAETLDILGDTPGCLRLLQSLRDHASASPEAAEAAWRIAVRVKLRLQKSALRSQGPWPQGRSKWLKTPTLLATGPGGELYLYQDDLDRAFVLREGQLSPAGPLAKGAKAMLVTPAGQLWLVTAKLGVVKEDSGTTPAPVAQAPTGAMLDRRGHLWVADGHAGSIQILAGEGPARTLAVNASALAAMPFGAVAAVDSGRKLLFLDQDGELKLTLPYGKDLPAPFKTVLALASDPLGHVAALVDGDFEGVVVWGPDGTVLRSATYKSLGLSGKFRAIALDHQGGLILADRSNDLLIRLD